MLKKTIVCLITFLLLTPPAFAKSVIYGKGVQLEQETSISELLANPDKYLGRRVKIRGKVAEVCTRRGCWMNIVGDRPHEEILIKVRDGEIVFPVQASGRMAVVEGIVDQLNLSRKQLVLYKKHLAQEGGQPFDPSGIRKGARVIRLLGIGAEIEE